MYGLCLSYPSSMLADNFLVGNILCAVEPASRPGPQALSITVCADPG